MDPEGVCDGTLHYSKKTQINLKKGRLLTPTDGVTATFQKADCAFSTLMSFTKYQGTPVQCTQCMTRYENKKEKN